ncbi:toxin-antitoxin system HicB family antitoxin [Candidatus Microgenomates bacterium]|nr:toxin-antitoxin system HicB family antitoxin [Candidatus Microgenomates bacterium]
MNWIATHIRLPEELHTKLKIKAAKEKKSLAKVLREAGEKVVESKTAQGGEERTQQLMKEIEEVAKENAKYTKGFDSVKALREIRYQE